jgi:pimeloyl-ACP methyl ester carboxylesterase
VHGFSQDHKSWWGTAEKLNNLYGHDIICPDLPGHGQSSLLPHPADFNITALVEFLRDVVVEVGWENSKIVVGGISMGGAVVQLYSMVYPDNVDRMVLYASGGMKESTFHLTSLFRGLAKSITNLLLVDRKTAPPEYLRHGLSLLHLIRTVPEYQIPQDKIEKHLLKYPLALIWGGLDECHSAQFEKRSGGRKDDQGVHILYVPWMGHMLCRYVNWMKLHEYPHFWHDCAAPHNTKFTKLQVKSRL